MESERIMTAHVLLPLLVLIPPLQAASASTDAPTMNIIAAGINSRGTSLWNDVSQFQKVGKTYRIEIDPEGSREQPKGAQQRDDPGSDPNNPRVPEIIHVHNPSEKVLKTWISTIAKERTVTVNIDMDLSGLHQSAWKEQTDKLAAIAQELAVARNKETGGHSINTMFAHSAATLALNEVNQNLFTTMIAASPQPAQLPKKAIVVLASGDLPSTNSGAILDATRSRTVPYWVSAGNTVLLIKGSRPIFLEDLLLSTVVLSPVAVDQELKREIAAHESTHDLGALDEDIEVHVPGPQGQDQSLLLSHLALGRIVRELEKERRACNCTTFDGFRFQQFASEAWGMAPHPHGLLPEQELSSEQSRIKLRRLQFAAKQDLSNAESELANAAASLQQAEWVLSQSLADDDGAAAAVARDATRIARGAKARAEQNVKQAKRNLRQIDERIKIAASVQ